MCGSTASCTPAGAWLSPSRTSGRPWASRPAFGRASVMSSSRSTVPASASSRRGSSCGPMLEPERILRLEDDCVVFLDQRRLPLEEVEVECRTAAEVAEAIRTMVVRGAPAIGVAAAYGLALAARNGEDLDAADRVLRESRPTAVNLAWALDELAPEPSFEHARR